MSSLIPSPFRRLAPYHILLYGALLGASLYQSLINTKVAFRAIPMPQFLGYQKMIFPIYFKLQVVLIPLVAVTYPNASLRGLLRERGLWVPLAVGMGCVAGNCFVWGPRCLKAMLERASEKASAEVPAGDPSAADQAFTKSHAMAIHLNFIALVCTIWYGFSLGSRVTVRKMATL